MKISEVDTHGAIKGSYMDGRFDSLPVPGKSIVCTIDARLQLFAEELMAGKVRGCRGDRTFDGRDSDDGFLAHIRSPMNWWDGSGAITIWSCSITNGSRCSTVP